MARKKVLPLHQVILAEGVTDDMLEALAAPGVDVDEIDGDGLTALHLASQFDYCDHVASLCESGANIRKLDGKGWTPLRTAVAYDSAGCVAVLCTEGADAEETDEDGDSLLHIAAMRRRIGAARELIRAGNANPNRADPAGDTALHFAAEANDLEAVEMLLALGADPGLRNVFQQTPLERHVAASGADTKVAAQLRKKTPPRTKH